MLKKISIILVVVLTTFVLAYSLPFHDYNPKGGWIASNGKNTAEGIACNFHYIPGGYAFICIGYGTCYEINGHDLWIYDSGLLGNGPTINIWPY